MAPTIEHDTNGVRRPPHGLLAEFDTPAALLHAARRVREAGYQNVEAYSPFPVDGLPEVLGFRKNRVSLVVGGGAIIGCLLAYIMQWYVNVDLYPLNIGGRPFHSWPSFIPITFEFTVLCAAFAAFIGFLALNGLPQLYHPVFEAPNYRRASQDGFFLCIEADDDNYDAVDTQQLLETLDPDTVTLIRRRT